MGNAIPDNSQLVPFGTNSFPGFPTSNVSRSQLVTLSDTKSFGAMALNELHLSFNRAVYQDDLPVGNPGIPATQFGFKEGVPGGYVPAVTSNWFGAPIIGFNNFTISLPGDTFNRYEDIPEALDNYSRVIGAHTVKLGGEYVYNDFYEPFPNTGNHA